MAVTAENCFLDRLNEKVKMRVASTFSEPELSLLGNNYSQREKRTSSRETQWLIIEQHLKQEVGQESFF